MKSASPIFRILLSLALLGFIGLGAIHAPHVDGEPEHCVVCKLGGPLGLNPDTILLEADAPAIGEAALPASVPTESAHLRSRLSRGPPASNR